MFACSVAGQLQIPRCARDDNGENRSRAASTCVVTTGDIFCTAPNHFLSVSLSSLRTVWIMLLRYGGCRATTAWVCVPSKTKAGHQECRNGQGSERLGSLMHRGCDRERSGKAAGNYCGI